MDATELVQLKKRLAKATSKSAAVHTLADAADALEVLLDANVKLSSVASTRIESTVKRLQKSSSPTVSKRASALASKWKRLKDKSRKGTETATKQPKRRSTRSRKKVNYNEDKLAEPSAAPAAAAKRSGYKTPPGASALPDQHQSEPSRHPKTGRLQFKDHPEFQPNLTPSEVLQRGSFGGTYFRPIYSSVTGVQYDDKQWKRYPSKWFKGLDIKRMVTSPVYEVTRNKYGVKCGGDLEMWESSGWISTLDPYGWFQWYCEFYTGRRSTDDARQISRWRGVASDKGRFRNQLIGRCYRAGKAFSDVSVSPVIRQTLQHWGYELTERDFQAYCKRKGWK